MFKSIINLFKKREMTIEEIDFEIDCIVMMMNGDETHDRVLHKEFNKLIKRGYANV